jgi:hypothetical protein
MKPAEGFVVPNKEHLVHKLERSLYGLNLEYDNGIKI